MHGQHATPVTARLAWVLLALLPLGARAVVVADPPPSTAPSLALVRLSFAPGDKKLEQQVATALAESGRVQVVKSAANAAFIGKLEITRAPGTTTLELEVLWRGGATLARVQQVVPTGGSLARGAQALALRAVAAIGSGRPPAPVEEPTQKPAQAPPAARAEPPGESRPPAPEAAQAQIAPPPLPPPTSAPRPTLDDDWSGQRARVLPPPPPRRLEFIVGAELGIGPWSADPAKLAAGSSTYDLSGYAPAFTSGIDQQWRPGLALHGGWKFLGYGAIELALQFSAWSNSGRANLIGARASGYPLKALWAKSPVELGLELGFGHSFLSSGSYDMTGSYLSLGLNVEYPLNQWFGVIGYYRLYMPFLGHFYVDYQRDRSEPVSFTAYWNTLGIGLNFHPAFTW